MLLLSTLSRHSQFKGRQSLACTFLRVLLCFCRFQIRLSAPAPTILKLPQVSKQADRVLDRSIDNHNRAALLQMEFGPLPLKTSAHADDGLRTGKPYLLDSFREPSERVGLRWALNPSQHMQETET